MVDIFGLMVYSIVSYLKYQPSQVDLIDLIWHEVITEHQYFFWSTIYSTYTAWFLKPIHFYLPFEFSQ